MTPHAPASWYAVTLTTNRMICEDIIQGSYHAAAAHLTRLIDQARTRGDEIKFYGVSAVNDPTPLLWNAPVSSVG